MIALAFSGGKDSLACLYLNRYRWDEITVVWVNTGKNYPEVLKTVKFVREVVPKFVEINVDRDKQNRENGIPTSLVSIDHTVYGMKSTGKTKTMKVQPYIECCLANISLPLHQWCLKNGVTEIIRGQRNDETRKGPARDGTMIDGIKISQPIEDWTKEKVLDFLSKEMDELPWHLRFEHSSMDCYDCTAYIENSLDRIEYMKEFYPKFYSEFTDRLSVIKKTLQEDLKLINEIGRGNGESIY